MDIKRCFYNNTRIESVVGYFNNAIYSVPLFNLPSELLLLGSYLDVAILFCYLPSEV